VAALASADILEEYFSFCSNGLRITPSDGWVIGTPLALTFF
jgi:hypothetical protein